jgi:glycerophosphoryl diester phosphodiesterase
MLSTDDGEESMQLIGHRGARFEAPENTVTGFRYGLGLGLDAFEFDIHMTKDGSLVVIHDATVDRTTNGKGAVADLTLDEIQALDARADFADWPEPARVPTFVDVLDVVGHVPCLEIEIKTDLPERIDLIVPNVVETINAYGIANQVYITSFDTYALDVAQRVAPEIRRGLIGAWDSEGFRELAESLGCSLAGVPYAAASNELVHWAKFAGLRITGWPTNSPEALAKALEFGVDAICTDAPTMMRELLAQTHS